MGKHLGRGNEMDQGAQHRAPAHRQPGPAQVDHTPIKRLHVGGIEGEAHFEGNRIPFTSSEVRRGVDDRVQKVR